MDHVKLTQNMPKLFTAKVKIIITTIVLINSALFIFLYTFGLPYLFTYITLTSAASNASTYDIKTGQIEKVDYWGNQIRIKRTPSKDKSHTTYSAISNGRDKKPNTNDDVEVTIIDPYKSPLIIHDGPIKDAYLNQKTDLGQPMEAK